MEEKSEGIINIKAFLYLVAIFLLFYCSSLLQYIPIFLFKIDKNSVSGSTSILLSLFSHLCLLIILFIFYRKSLLEDFKKFKKNAYQILDTSVKYYLLGVLGMIITNLLITFLLQGGGATNEKMVQDMISTSPMLMVLSAGIIGPIIEELVFRKTYLEAFKNKYLCIFLSGFIFGFMHVISSANSLVEYLYFIPYMSLGLCFAAMDYKEKNIFPSICMHMLHNTLLILLSIM